MTIPDSKQPFRRQSCQLLGACRQNDGIASVPPPCDSPCSGCSETGMMNFLDP